MSTDSDSRIRNQNNYQYNGNSYESAQASSHRAGPSNLPARPQTTQPQQQAREGYRPNQQSRQNSSPLSTAAVRKVDRSETVSEDEDPTRQYVDVLSSTTGSWAPVDALLDSGSDDNWISEELVQRLKLERNTEKAEGAKTANGGEMRSIGTVEIDWSFKGSPKTRRSTFQVATRPSFSLLICRKLLFGEGIFQFDKKCLAITKPDKKCLVMVKNTAGPSKVEKEQMERDRAKANSDSNTIKNLKGNKEARNSAQADPKGDQLKKGENERVK